MAVDERDNMWMLKALENIDLGRETFFQLPVELRQIDGLDSYVAPRSLGKEK